MHVLDFPSGSFLDVKVGGGVEPVHEESAWQENEEKMTGLVCKLDGKLRHALTGK